VIVWLLALVLAGPPAVAERRVMSVDLERAVVATRDGKRIKDELDVALTKLEEQVRAREQELAKLRKVIERTGDPSARADYERGAENLERFIADEERKLGDKQDTLLAPVLDKMRALAQDTTSAVVITEDEYPRIAPSPACDATMWIARAYESNKRVPLNAPVECSARVIVQVDVQAVLARMEEGRVAASQLDSLQKQRQAELDRRQREVERIADSADRERARLDVAARYQAYQQEIEERGKASQKRAEVAARAYIVDATKSHQGAVLVDRIDGARAVDIATCDATSWFVGALETKTPLADLATVCPALK
jgi:Skp family chaperone for outer membrane proteins